VRNYRQLMVTLSTEPFAKAQTLTKSMEFEP